MVASGLRNVVPLSGSTRPAATLRSTPSKSGVPPKVRAMPLSWSSGAAISIPDPICLFHGADLERFLFGWNDDFMCHRPLRSYRGHLLGVMAGLVLACPGHPRL